MPRNWLDRGISAIAPGWGLSRARARLRLDAVTAYEAARMPVRERWRDRDGGPNDELGNALAVLRRRSRAMVRDNPYAKEVQLAA